LMPWSGAFFSAEPA